MHRREKIKRRIAQVRQEEIALHFPPAPSALPTSPPADSQKAAIRSAGTRGAHVAEPGMASEPAEASPEKHSRGRPGRAARQSATHADPDADMAFEPGKGPPEKHRRGRPGKAARQSAAHADPDAIVQYLPAQDQVNDPAQQQGAKRATTSKAADDQFAMEQAMPAAKPSRSNRRETISDSEPESDQDGPSKAVGGKEQQTRRANSRPVQLSDAPHAEDQDIKAQTSPAKARQPRKFFKLSLANGAGPNSAGHKPQDQDPAPGPLLQRRKAFASDRKPEKGMLPGSTGKSGQLPGASDDAVDSIRHAQDEPSKATGANRRLRHSKRLLPAGHNTASQDKHDLLTAADNHGSKRQRTTRKCLDGSAPLPSRLPRARNAPPDDEPEVIDLTHAGGERNARPQHDCSRSHTAHAVHDGGLNAGRSRFAAEPKQIFVKAPGVKLTERGHAKSERQMPGPAALTQPGNQQQILQPAQGRKQQKAGSILQACIKQSAGPRKLAKAPLRTRRTASQRPSAVARVDHAGKGKSTRRLRSSTLPEEQHPTTVRSSGAVAAASSPPSAATTSDDSSVRHGGPPAELHAISSDEESAAHEGSDSQEGVLIPVPVHSSHSPHPSPQSSPTSPILRTGRSQLNGSHALQSPPQSLKYAPRHGPRNASHNARGPASAHGLSARANARRNVGAVRAGFAWLRELVYGGRKHGPAVISPRNLRNKKQMITRSHHG